MKELAKLTFTGQEAAKIEEIISTIIADHIQVNYKICYPSRTGKHTKCRRCGTCTCQMCFAAWLYGKVVIQDIY